MTAFLQNGTTVVDCLRIESQSSDRLTIQHRIGHLLSNANLQPPSLAPSAILIVRTLRGREPASGPGHYYDVYLPAEWEESTSSALESSAARAERPFLKAVAPSAPAVLFLDRAELLACLARDWVSGTLCAHWWWSALLRHAEPEFAVYREWLDSPQFLPAALENLVLTCQAEEFLRRLPSQVVTSLLCAMLQVHAVPTVTEGESKSATTVSADQTTIQDMVVEPWSRYVPEASIPDLPVSKTILLAQALMLRRSPSRVRQRSFQREMANWQSWKEFTLERAWEKQNPSEDKPVAGRGAVSKTIEPSQELFKEDAVASERSSSLAFPSSAFDTPHADPFSPTSTETETPVVNIARAMAEHNRANAAHEPGSFGRECSCGGLFFLLNVGLHLKLYADFTSPRSGNLDLNIWDFLYLLGCHFVPSELKGDTVFDILLNLAGHSDGEQPGSYFRPPQNWRMPLEWLEAFPESFARQEVIQDSRTQILHPAGFILVDEARDGELQPANPLQRWLSWIELYTRARLSRALGRADAAAFLCSVPASVVATASHVDVAYSLATYPVEIRMAGLDRNPGWIPAAGRFVTFHFE